MATLDDTAINAARDRLPSHMIEGLLRYINHGIEPGDFLQAVLKNHLIEAFSRADEFNAEAMQEWARWLYNYAPSQCFGSVEKYGAWAARGGLNGDETA